MIVHHKIVEDFSYSLKDLESLLEVKDTKSDSTFTKLHTDAKVYSFLWCIDILRTLLVDIYSENFDVDEAEVRFMSNKDLVDAFAAKKVFHKDVLGAVHVLLNLFEVMSMNRSFLDGQFADHFDKAVDDIGKFRQFMCGIVEEIMEDFDLYELVEEGENE